jgi:hypothetical protein
MVRGNNYNKFHFSCREHLKVEREDGVEGKEKINIVKREA